MRPDRNMSDRPSDSRKQPHRAPNPNIVRRHQSMMSLLVVVNRLAWTSGQHTRGSRPKPQKPCLTHKAQTSGKHRSLQRNMVKPFLPQQKLPLQASLFWRPFTLPAKVGAGPKTLSSEPWTVIFKPETLIPKPSSLNSENLPPKPQSLNSENRTPKP